MLIFPANIYPMNISNHLGRQVSYTHRLRSGTATQNGLAETIAEINQTVRAIRSLADYLDRHPEALLRGRGPRQ